VSLFTLAGTVAGTLAGIVAGTLAGIVAATLAATLDCALTHDYGKCCKTCLFF